MLHFFKRLRYSAKVVFVVLQLSLISNCTLAQETVEVAQIEEMLMVGRQTYFLEDPEGTLTFSDILKPENRDAFQLNPTDIFNRPATPSVFWFKITVQNKTERELWLEIGDSFTSWYLDFYAPDASGNYAEPLLIGSLRPQKNKQYSSDNFCVPLSRENRPITYYLRVAGDFPKTHVFQIGSTKALGRYLSYSDNIAYAFIGLALAMFIYNLFLLYSTRERAYAAYMAYLLSMFIPVTFDSGYLVFHHNWLWENFFIWHNIFFIFMTMFASSYLNLKQNAPKLRIWLWALTVILSGIIPLITLAGLVPFTDMFNIMQAVNLLHSFSLLYTGCYLWFKGQKNARFFVFAWFFLIASVFIFLGTINGGLPMNTLTHNIIYVGMSLEILLFGLALGDKLNQLQKEKAAIHAESVEQLEKRVNEKTKEVQDAYQELQVNNEELQQLQEETGAQRDLLMLNNDELTRFKTRIGKSISSAKLIQTAILPTRQSLEKHFSDYFILYFAKDVVSGDFYWLNTNANHKIFVAADCTGHGVSGAFMTMIGNSVLDHIIRFQGVISPVQIMEKMHRQLRQVLQQEATGNDDGMDMTIVRISESGEERKLVFGAAKQNLFYTSDGEEIKIIKGSRKHIGGFSNSERNFEEHELNLPAGSLLYLCSDGYIDQNNPERQKFGLRRFVNTLDKNKKLPLGEQKDVLVKELSAHRQDSEQRDDITVIGLKI